MGSGAPKRPRRRNRQSIRNFEVVILGLNILLLDVFRDDLIRYVSTRSYHPSWNVYFGLPPVPIEQGRGDIDEKQAEVTLTRPFKMAATETTQLQWRSLGFPDPSKAAPCDDCAQEWVS